MKHLSFKLLALCILLPPFLYAFSLSGLENLLQKRYLAQIQSVYTAGTSPSLMARRPLEEIIAANIDAYLEKVWLRRVGVVVQVTVRTGQGNPVYPAAYADHSQEWRMPDPLALASTNYQLLSQGLQLDLSVIIPHNTLFANAILLLLTMAALLALWHFYRASAKTAQAEADRSNTEIQRLHGIKSEFERHLESLQQQRTELEGQLKQIRDELQAEKSKADATENEMLEALTALEIQLLRKVDRQQELENEIDQLKGRLETLDNEEISNNRSKSKPAESAARRFGTLYKQLTLNERAVKGFLELPEDMKIKAEEMLQQLNYEPDKVLVKRKVFGKKNSATVLESLFAYKGRIYYRKTANKIEILAIGTKHTQTRDLAFLEKI
ncbi:hypothetical protein [Desulfatitalea tepidiphila]|uniref:hypothetical protein n=1 Tax=Desulfatitalea tepidiphila TaxID=1185843 RepID=UPI0006B591F0|nr:hypothetical protein [Desulfatitalea tepidiphila]